MRKKFTGIVAIAAIAAVAALALTGCSTTASASDAAAPAKPFKVVAFTSGNQVPIGAWWVKALTAKAAELGWDLTMIQGDFDFQKMNPAVESAIGQGADAVFDGFTDVASIGSIVTAAKDANIPMFAIDSATSAQDAFAINITTDQQAIADKSMAVLDKALGGVKGKTIMVIGHDPHPGIRLRAALMEKALTAAGAIIAGGEIQKVASPATGRTESLAFVSAYITANPGQLDAVWTGWDDSAMGALKAIDEAGSKAKVVGVNAEAEALAEIQKGGNFLATIEQPWPAIFDTVIADMVAYQKDGTMPAKNYDAVGVNLVDMSNAASITPSDKLK